MEIESMEAIISSALEILRDKEPDDRSVPEAFIRRAMGLWLVYEAGRGNDVKRLLAMRAESQGVGGFFGSIDTKTFLLWVDIRTMPRVLHHAMGRSFEGVSAALMEAASNADLQVRKMVARCIRDEILDASIGGAAARWPAAEAARYASVYTELGEVLTRLCSVLERADVDPREGEAAAQGPTALVSEGAPLEDGDVWVAARGEEDDKIPHFRVPSPVPAAVAAGAGAATVAKGIVEVKESEAGQAATAATSEVIAGGPNRESKTTKGRRVFEMEEAHVGVQGQGGVEEMKHERADHRRQVTREAETSECSDEVANIGMAKRLPGACAVVEKSKLVCRRPMNHRDVAVQSEGVKDAGEDKFSLIVSMLGSIQRFVDNGFSKQAREQEELKVGQRLLADQVDRLSCSLLNMSSASPQRGDDVRGRVRTDQVSSSSVARAAGSAKGVREGGDFMVAVPERHAPTTRALSSKVLSAAGGKQQMIRSSRQRSDGAAKKVPDIAANLKQAAQTAAKGEPALPPMVRAGTSLSSSVPAVPLSSTQTTKAAGSATRDESQHAQEKDKGGGHEVAQHRDRDERYGAQVASNAKGADMHAARNAGGKESDITMPPAVLKGEAGGTEYDKSSESSTTTAKRERPPVDKSWPRYTALAAPAEKVIGVEKSAGDDEGGALAPVVPSVALTLPPAATVLTAGCATEGGEERKVGGVSVDGVMRVPGLVRLRPLEMTVDRVIEKDGGQPNFPSVSHPPLPVQVSGEERRRPDTLQGESSDSVVLESSELPPSSDVFKDIEVVRTTLETDNGAGLCRAITIARTLLVHHGGIFQRQQGEEQEGAPPLLRTLVSLVSGAVRNTHSPVRKNALRAVREVFSGATAKLLNADELTILVSAVTGCYKFPTRFYKKEADKAMAAAICNIETVPLLNAVLPNALDNHPRVASQAMVYAEKSLSHLAVGGGLKAGLRGGLDAKSLVQALTKGAVSRVVDAREAVCRAMKRHAAQVIRDLVYSRAYQQMAEAQRAAAEGVANNPDAENPARSREARKSFDSCFPRRLVRRKGRVRRGVARTSGSGKGRGTRPGDGSPRASGRVSPIRSPRRTGRTRAGADSGAGTGVDGAGVGAGEGGRNEGSGDSVQPEAVGGLIGREKAAMMLVATERRRSERPRQPLSPITPAEPKQDQEVTDETTLRKRSGSACGEAGTAGRATLEGKPARCPKEEMVDGGRSISVSVASTLVTKDNSVLAGVVENSGGDDANRSRDDDPREAKRAAQPPVPLLEKSDTERVQDAAAGGGAAGMAAGEMVPAVPEHGTIKPREVSEEERAMAGAPQGQIFDVVVLETSEVPKSLVVSTDIEIVRTAADKPRDDWGALYAAVSSARTLLLHHDEVFNVGQEEEAERTPGLVGLVVSIVADAVSHNRSVIQSTGLRGFEELFSGKAATMLNGDEMKQLVRAVGACQKSSKSFTAAAAQKATNTAAAKADPSLLLSAVLPQGLDKHPKVSAEAVTLANKCLSRLGVGDVPSNGLPDWLDKKLLVEVLAKGARCRIASAKEAASTGLERCRNALGKEGFDAVVAEYADRPGARAIHDLLSTAQRRREKASAADSGSRTGPAAKFPRRSVVDRDARKAAAGSARGVRGRMRAAALGACGHIAAEGGGPALAQEQPSPLQQEGEEPLVVDGGASAREHPTSPPNVSE